MVERELAVVLYCWEIVTDCSGGCLQTVSNVLERQGFHKVLAVVRDSSAKHSVLSPGVGVQSCLWQAVVSFSSCFQLVHTLLWDTTTTTVLQPLYRSTSVSWHLKLITGGFCWCQVFCRHALADSNQRIQVREKTLEFSPTLFSTLSPYGLLFYENMKRFFSQTLLTVCGIAVW